MNFFGWIRDGVRKAVILGVADAVNDLGSPTEDDPMSRRLLEVIRNGPPELTDQSAETSEPAKRRKLGRGLQEIQAAKATS